MLQLWRQWTLWASRDRSVLEAELAVGAEADELEGLRVGFAVDEDEVRLDVAVAVVVPVAGQRVVAVAGG